MKTNYIQKKALFSEKVNLTDFFKNLWKEYFFFLCTFHNVEKWKIYSHWENISSNQLFSDFFSKNVAFTKILPKSTRSAVCAVWSHVTLNCPHMNNSQWNSRFSSLSPHFCTSFRLILQRWHWWPYIFLPLKTRCQMTEE